MRRLLPLALLTVFVSGCPILVMRAQEQEEKSAGEPEEEARPYIPPAAWKSVEIGNFYLRRKKYRGALGRFQEAVKTDPHYAPAYLGLGKAYEKIGLRRKALEAYRKYLDELPSTKDALEAKQAQRAVARLEKELATSHKPSARGAPPH